MRKSWIYTKDGRCIEKGTPEHVAYLENLDAKRGPAVFSDEGEFVSPIDGKVYSGRAGMREHCVRHDVVNNRDLVGLPVGINPKGEMPKLSTRERQELRQAVFEAAKSKGYLEGQ